MLDDNEDCDSQSDDISQNSSLSTNEVEAADCGEADLIAYHQHVASRESLPGMQFPLWAREQRRKGIGVHSNDDEDPQEVFDAWVRLRELVFVHTPSVEQSLPADYERLYARTVGLGAAVALPRMMTAEELNNFTDAANGINEMIAWLSKNFELPRPTVEFIRVQAKPSDFFAKAILDYLDLNPEASWCEAYAAVLKEYADEPDTLEKAGITIHDVVNDPKAAEGYARKTLVGGFCRRTGREPPSRTLGRKRRK